MSVDDQPLEAKDSAPPQEARRSIALVGDQQDVFGCEAPLTLGRAAA